MSTNSSHLRSLPFASVHGVSSVSHDTNEIVVSLRQGEDITRHRFALNEARLLERALGSSISAFDQRNQSKLGAPKA